MSNLVRLTESELVEMVKVMVNERMQKPSLDKILQNHIDEATSIMKDIASRNISKHEKKSEIKQLVKDIVSKHNELKKLLSQGEITPED